MYVCKGVALDTDAVPDHWLFDLGDLQKFFVPEAPHFFKNGNENNKYGPLYKFLCRTKSVDLIILAVVILLLALVARSTSAPLNFRR